MQMSTPREVCAFCGTIGDERTRYAGGFGVLMCEECVSYFSDAMARARQGQSAQAPVAGGRRRALTRYDADALSNEEVLEMLPRIAATAHLVNAFLADWVEQIRSRRLSWTTIGNAMGVSRQAAWERFTRILSTERHDHSS